MSSANKLTIALVPIAILINIILGSLAAFLKIPLYFDTIGTIIVGVLSGPIAGGLTGLISGLLWYLFPSPLGFDFALAFTPTTIVVGILAGLFGPRSWLRKWPTSLLSGVLSGTIATLVTVPIITYLFPEVPTPSTDLLKGYLAGVASSPLTSTFLQSATSYLPDQIISYLLTFLFLGKWPRHLLVRFPQGRATAPAKRRPLIGRVD